MNNTIVEKARKLGLQLYRGTYQEDIHLLKWWLALTKTSEIEEAFPKKIHPLAEFMNLFKPPRTLVYALTDDKLWFATWLEPLLHGIYLSTWTDKTMRGTKAHFNASFTVCEGILNVYPVILSVTHNTRLAKILQRAGYISLGEVPNLYDGNSLHFAYLTKSAFEASEVYQLGAKI